MIFVIYKNIVTFLLDHYLQDFHIFFHMQLFFYQSNLQFIKIIYKNK